MKVNDERKPTAFAKTIKRKKTMIKISPMMNFTSLFLLYATNPRLPQNVLTLKDETIMHAVTKQTPSTTFISLLYYLCHVSEIMMVTFH